jgi:Ser/Thr protein kinase RdoA (MazF antagonist)
MSSSDESIRSAAARMCGAPVSALTIVGGGGNNRVYRVEAGGSTYALKAYPSREHDPRDRLQHEFEALRFISERFPRYVPAPVAADRQLRVAVYTWVDGTRVTSHGTSDVRVAASFAHALHTARNDAGARTLMPASEAIFGNADLIEQIEVRMHRLRGVAIDEPELDAFLRERFEPELAARRELDPAYDALPPQHRTLSPSDFGFHNALRQPDGELVFIDFEYFGWDDPVKLVSDFLWHPAVELDAGERAALLTAAATIYAGDPAFGERRRAYSPLIALRWVAIILNEFVPEVWKRRVYAGQTGAWDEIKACQLAKAGKLLDRLAAEGE